MGKVSLQSLLLFIFVSVVKSLVFPTLDTQSYQKMMAFWSSWITFPPPPPSTLKRNDSGIKKVTFLRHGCTYMNEYLGGKDGGKRFGSPDFSDVFDHEEQRRKYHDSPLSPLGRSQATTLGSHKIPPSFIRNCELVVVSPLTRALQTFEMGVRPHFTDDQHRDVAIVAHPAAAERLYLISDVGQSVVQLREKYPHIDFESGWNSRLKEEDAWWYQPNGDYEEWRPTGKGQRYACPGEPYEVFNIRMSQFYHWLNERTESNIVVVCHHGVIDWMLDVSFANCQYKQLPFASVQPRTLIKIIEQEKSTATVARL
jgi:broad specificity phosphatase PhoE